MRALGSRSPCPLRIRSTFLDYAQQWARDANVSGVIRSLLPAVIACGDVQYSFDDRSAFWLDPYRASGRAVDASAWRKSSTAAICSRRQSSTCLLITVSACSARSRRGESYLFCFARWSPLTPRAASGPGRRFWPSDARPNHSALGSFSERQARRWSAAQQSARQSAEYGKVRKPGQAL
jgi:hypothetical protein